MAHFYKLIITAWLAVFACESNAAAVAIIPPAGIAANASGFATTSSFAGSFSAASFNANFTTNVGGKMVTMPATMRMAANAGQFAMGAVRLNPVGLIGSALAAYLLTNGISWLNDQWQEVTEPTPAITRGHNCVGGGGVSIDQQAACNQFVTVTGWPAPITPTGIRADGFLKCFVVKWNVTYYCGPVTVPAQCPAGQTLTNGMCYGTPQPVPDSKWDDIASQPLPDSVAGELAPKIPLPLQNPEFNPPYADVPLGDPRIDPRTGERVRDYARVTPQSDGKSADVQTYQRPVDENGNPSTDPTTGNPTPATEPTDACQKNPDAAGCKPLDEVPDSELPQHENSFSLNPVSGFGADNAACPAPQTLFNKGGQTITWDWGKFCGFAQGIRPLIIGFAWLTALMIVVSVGRRNG